jgi:uncharacterized protein (UPF0548 family)
MPQFTYAEVGATQHRPLPRHYNHLRYRVAIGTGTEVFEHASRAVLSFDAHRATGARIVTDAAAAAPGVRVTIKLGPLTVPCEVVYTVHEPARAGFGYGTLPGHLERGEEAFLVERDADDLVWFQVVAFSRPAHWAAVLSGPLAVLAQYGYARLLGRALRRVAGPSRTVGR